MATTAQVVVRAHQAPLATHVVGTTMRWVEDRMNEWRPGSALAAISHGAAGAPVPTPRDVRALIRRGVELGRLTRGAFDITWAALWGVWDFRSPHPRVPARAEIARRLPLIDYRLVELDDEAGTVRLPRPGMVLGLGGIAKGYALELAATWLQRWGVHDFLLTAGGQVLARGSRGDRPWRVGIRDPRGPQEDVFATVALRDASASTSGDYERFFVQDGVRYHHILDPRTGWPTQGLRSATVIDADGTRADALSTALMVLGPTAGMALVERLPGVEAVLVDRGGGLIMSTGARSLVEVSHAPHRGD